MAEGAQIIWVLEQDPTLQPGTAEGCMEVMDALNDPASGWCVGDEQTEPVPGAFDDSPFSVNRGFDMIVPTRTMRIAYTTSHGSSPDDENPSGQEVLEALRDIVDGL